MLRKRHDKLQHSFDIRFPSRRSCIPKGTSRACGDHVCVIWLKSVEGFSRYAPETTWQVYNLLRPSFDLHYPSIRPYTPKGTYIYRACEDHVCVTWLKSVEQFSRYAPETKSVTDGRTDGRDGYQYHSSPLGAGAKNYIVTVTLPFDAASWNANSFGVLPYWTLLWNYVKIVREIKSLDTRNHFLLNIKGATNS
jgi:hypothetical protein